MYTYNYGNLEPSLIRTILIYAFCVMVINIIVRVLLALAVNNDGKAIGVKNTTLWSVLEFFFPVIVGIIYLCSRNSIDKTVPRYCMSCGATMPPNTKVCYNCSGNMLLDYIVTDAEKYKKARKAFLVGGISIFVAMIIFSQIFGLKLASDIIRTYDKPNGSGSYEDYFDDYFDDFGKYFEQYGREENPPSDDNDFFDDFNNFGSGEEEEQQSPEGDPFGFFDNNGD